MESSNGGAGPVVSAPQGAAQSTAPSGPSFAPAKSGQDFNKQVRGPETSAERGLWENLVDTNKMTLEQVNAERASFGLAPLSKPPPKTRWESAYDRLEPEVKGVHQYDLSGVIGDMNGPDAEESRLTDQAVRETLVAGRFSAEAGKTFAQLCADADKSIQGYPPEKIQEHLESERQKLIQIYGSEQAFQEKVQLVNEFIDSVQMKAPATTLFLRESGALSSALAFSYLANHASLIKARHGRF